MGYHSYIGDLRGFEVKECDQKIAEKIDHALKKNDLDTFLNFELKCSSGAIVSTEEHGKAYCLPEAFEQFLADIPRKIREKLSGEFTRIGEGYNDAEKYIVDEGELTILEGHMEFG